MSRKPARPLILSVFRMKLAQIDELFDRKHWAPCEEGVSRFAKCFGGRLVIHSREHLAICIRKYVEYCEKIGYDSPYFDINFYVQHIRFSYLANDQNTFTYRVYESNLTQWSNDFWLYYQTLTTERHR